MFADSMLETSWAQRSRRSWTTLTSFGLEAVVIGVLLLLPLWKTVGLPSVRTVSTPVTLGRAPGAARIADARHGAATVTPRDFSPGRLMLPSRLRPVTASGNDSADQLPDAIGSIGIGFPSGTKDGLPIPVIGGNQPVMPARPAQPAIHAFRPSTLLEGSLIRRVQPVYPPLARTARIQGPVVLFATISKAGTIANLRLMTGHPMLVPAAIDAVSHWRYRPYILNNEAIEVETQITVNFILGN